MNCLEITMLGEFTLTYNGITINEQAKRSKKLWTLLKFLIANRGREVGQNECAELLWRDSPEKHIGALKTQLHRLRETLREMSFPMDIVINSGGFYSINKDIELSVDSDMFERLCEKISQGSYNNKERLELFRHAISLYKGNYLEDDEETEQWIIPIRAHFKKLYVNTVLSQMELLYQENMLPLAKKYCELALEKDSYNQQLQYEHIRVLSSLGNRDAAQEQYNYVISMCSKLGLTPLKELTSLYENEISVNRNIETNLDNITSGFNELNASGALCCELDAFKSMYRFETRNNRRNERNCCISLLTITDEYGDMPERESLKKAMTLLSAIIGRTLRCGDIYSRYSVSQYISMLPDTTEDNIENVMKRIVLNFRKENTDRHIEIQYQTRPVLKI